MRSRSPRFYIIVLFVTLLLAALVLQFVRDGVYFYQLQALDSDKSMVTGGSLTVRAERSIEYVFDVDGKQYRGEARANGFAINQLAVRYLPADPRTNIPTTSDIPAERAFALLRLVTVAGFVTIGVTAYTILRRK
jgi:hypothetical protein